MLPDYFPWLDPSGHAPCSIALASLDHLFEEECRSQMIGMEVELALPLGWFLLGVQSFLGRHLQGRREDLFFESLVAFLALLRGSARAKVQFPSCPAKVVQV